AITGIGACCRDRKVTAYGSSDAWTTRVQVREKGVPPLLIRVIERLIFAATFVLAPSDAANGAFAWLTLKMAANWQQQPAEDEDRSYRRDHRCRAVRALLL